MKYHAVSSFAKLGSYFVYAQAIKQFSETVPLFILSLPLIQEGQLSVTDEKWAFSIGKLPRRLAQEMT